MKEILKKIYKRESFYPSLLMGVWINPAFIVRRGILKGIKNISSKFIGGKLLDVGCGSKPYEQLFKVEEYIGIDVETSGHNHLESKIDKFYDGVHIPYGDNEFNWVLSSEVFEHVFNLDQLLLEINRVLSSGGKLAFTCPFVWEEHEQPYDYARYSSFALKHIIEKNGFRVESYSKSSSYFETLMQLLAMYIYQNCLPNNKYIKIILIPFFVAPFNILGSLLGRILPKNSSLYLSNIVVAVKK